MVKNAIFLKAIQLLEEEANQLDAWIAQIYSGSWSTFQVDSMRKRAEHLRKKANELKRRANRPKAKTAKSR